MAVLNPCGCLALARLNKTCRLLFELKRVTSLLRLRHLRDHFALEQLAEEYILRGKVAAPTAAAASSWQSAPAPDISGLNTPRCGDSEPIHIKSFHGGRICAKSGWHRLGAMHGNARGVIQRGLVSLVATPVARVLFFAIAFAVVRDRLCVVLTLKVLAAPAHSLFGPQFE